MRNILVCIFTTILGSVGFAAGCPNLSGFYWDTPADKPETNIPGRMLELRQQACDKISLYVHWVDQKGKDVFPADNAYIWNLGSLACTTYQPGVDCRAHPFTQNVISTIENGVTTDPSNPSKGTCSFDQFDWSLDSNHNIVEITPVRCTNGHSGNLQRVLERAR